MFGFDKALQLLKAGNLVHRSGKWDDDEFIYLVRGGSFIVNRAPLLGIFPSGTICTYKSRIDRNDGNGTLSGAGLTDDDLLAEDWEMTDVMDRAFIDHVTKTDHAPLPIDTDTDGPLTWPLNLISDEQCVVITDFSLGGITSAQDDFAVKYGSIASYIAIGYSDIAEWAESIPDYGDHLVTGTSASIIEHGYLGRLQGRVACTDAYLRPQLRFIERSFVC